MAIKKNTNDLISQAATTLADNSTQDISPQDVREMAENNAFSSYNKITDNNLVGLKNYSTAATYEAAQGVVYNGSIYISNTIPTPGAFNASEWDILSGGEINTSSNSGAGEGLALAKSGSNLPFKSITAGTGITLTSAANELQISSDSGEVNTSSNSGAGEGLALAKSGSNLPFKSLTAGTGITLTSAANELQISSAGGTDTNIGNSNITFDANRYAQTGVYSWTLGGTAPIGAEKISLQKDTLIKGSNNSVNTNGFKVTDVNNNSLLEVKNNGRFATNGSNVNSSFNVAPDGTSANIFTVSYLDKILHTFTVQNFAIRNTAGTLDLLRFSVQSGVSKLVLSNTAGTNFLNLQSGNDGYYARKININSATTSHSKAVIQLNQSSSNVSSQLFFANITTTTLGRLGSVAGWGATEKGFECYDTDINKKFFWNGSAWEKIKGNIESVTQATATTLTPNIDNSTMEIMSSLAAALTIAAPTGTPHEGQELTFRFKDDGTARALTWNAIFEDYTGSLPTTTTAGKTVYIGCKYNLINTKWDVVAVQTQP